MTTAAPETDASAKALCFVIAPIGPADSEIRKKSDQVLKHLVKKALDSDYAVERADDISRPGIITVQIIQRLFEAPMVIADLTDHNPNVFYELAIRHATKKPTIHIIAEGQDIPFDVQGMRVVPYNLGNPDSLDAARAELRAHNIAITKGEEVITPVQIAQILASVAGDQGRDEKIYALIEALTTGISNLQSGIGEIVTDVRTRRFSEAFGSSAAPFLGLRAASTLAAPATGFNATTQSDAPGGGAAESNKSTGFEQLRKRHKKDQF